MVRVRPLSVASRGVVALAKKIGAKFGRSLRIGETTHRSLQGFVFRITKTKRGVAVDVIDLPTRVVGDLLAARAGGGVGTLGTVTVPFSRDALYGPTGVEVTDPTELGFNITSETFGAQVPLAPTRVFYLGASPAGGTEAITTYDNFVQGGAKENGRVVSRLVTDTAGLRILQSGGDPPDTVTDTAKFWMEVETVNLRGRMDKFYISEDWVRSNFYGYRFISTAYNRGGQPLPVTSAYRRGDRLVVAISVRKQLGPYQEPAFNSGDGSWGTGLNKDSGNSALLLLDLKAGTQDDPTAIGVTASHIWELASESDVRLVPTKWHEHDPPYFDSYWAEHLGMATNSILPTVTIAANGDVLGVATVMCLRTPLSDSPTSASAVIDAAKKWAPTQAVVTFSWPVGGVFQRTVQEATIHYSEGMVYEALVDDNNATGTPFIDRIPWVHGYPRLQAIVTAGAGSTFDAAYARTLIEDEEVLFAAAAVLSSTDDQQWEVGIIYHRFKAAGIKELGGFGKPIWDPGTTATFDAPNKKSINVSYPTLYAVADFSTWVKQEWDSTGVKASTYPFINGQTYVRGIGMLGMGVDLAVTSSIRQASQLGERRWVFAGKPFDTLNNRLFSTLVASNEGYEAKIAPPDPDLPGPEVDASRLSAVQRWVPSTDPDDPVPKDPGVFMFTPGSGQYVSSDAGDAWVRVHRQNLGQAAFIGNVLWPLAPDKAKEI